MNLEALSPLREKALEHYAEYDRHELVVPVLHEGEVCGFIAVHRFGKNGVGSGGTRFWNFGNKEEALQDALRLSRAMTHKHALGGSPFGGAKAVLFSKNNTCDTKLLKSYADTINALDGKFTTGMDVGFSQKEVDVLKTLTPHLVGLDRDLSEFTGIGLLYALESSLSETFGNSEMGERTLLLQGSGKVGEHFLRALKARMNSLPKIFFAETNAERSKIIRSLFPNALEVKPENIFEISADVFIPCALGGIITEKTAEDISVKIVCGAANNQLGSPEAGEALYRRGILYAPDYIANAGGMIAVVDEHEHRNFDRPRLLERLGHIPKTLSQIFARSKKENRPPERVADEMAKSIFDPV